MLPAFSTRLHLTDYIPPTCSCVPNTPSLCDPLGAAAEAILRKKAQAQTENKKKRDNARRKAAQIMRGKNVKGGRKGNNEQAEDGQVEGAIAPAFVLCLLVFIC